MRERQAINWFSPFLAMFLLSSSYLPILSLLLVDMYLLSRQQSLPPPPRTILPPILQRSGSSLNSLTAARRHCPNACLRYLSGITTNRFCSISPQIQTSYHYCLRVENGRPIILSLAELVDSFMTIQACAARDTQE